MKFFSEIIRLFQDIDIFISEKLDAVETSFAITYSRLPSMEQFRDILKLVPQRDLVNITLVSDSDDIVIFTNYKTDSIDYFFKSGEILPEDNINIRIQINKNVSGGKFSIYDYDSFVTDLLARSILEVLNWFSKKLSGQDSLIFEVFDCDISFSTRTMVFESREDVLFAPEVDRFQRLCDCKENSCFYNMDMFEVLPDDFIIQGVIRSNNRLQLLFSKLATILSLAYISSSSSINYDTICLQIAGQRMVNCDIKLDDIEGDKRWQDIYTWIFTEGNSTDKALIAHNVLSLYCKFETFLNLNDTVFEAIKTNYKLYLRNNISQYLNMKHDMANFIQNIVIQVGDYTTAILGKFKANVLAIFGFLFTVVLTQIGSEQNWKDIFTVHTIYLIELFACGSLIYLLICFFETYYKFQKTKLGYENLKQNYADILSELEIKEVFQDDKLMKNAEKTVKKGMIGWSLVWGGLLIIIVIIIEALTTNHGLIVWFCDKLFELRS